MRSPKIDLIQFMLRVYFLGMSRMQAANSARSTFLNGALLVIFGVLVPLSASAAIPTSERDVLLALYTSTNGDGWIDNFGWNDAVGTECTWYGVVCDTTPHVTTIQLSNNGLNGTLPDLSNLGELQIFHVEGNSLSGNIPALSALVNLQEFHAEVNQLTGAFPDISGLTNLQWFSISTNHVNGPIPNLNALASLSLFDVDTNQLTGTLPSLSGLSSLRVFSSSQNQLTGTIPNLAGLSNLQMFNVGQNELSGSIPDLTGLVNLNNFGVFHNNLTGAIPTLTGLGALQFFDVGMNQLSGNIPDPPSPNNLVAGFSRLCTNNLDFHSSSATQHSWNIATGITPWYSACGSEEIFLDAFE